TGLMTDIHGQTPQTTIHEFSIQQCIDYAHAHSAQIKNALLDLQIQQQTNKSITAGALPTLSATGSTTVYFNIPVQPVSDFITPAIYGVLVDKGVKDGNGNPITMPTGNPAVFPFSLYQKYSASGSIQLTQTLFDGQVFVGLQARKASIDYYQKAIDITEEGISVNIYKVYYQLVVSKTQMEQIDANIARAQKLLNDATAMYQNGFQEKLDVDKATVQLANLQTQKSSVQTTIDNGYLGLKYLIGMSVKDSLILTDKFTEDDLKSGVLGDTAYNYENRNDYQGLLLSQKLNEYNVKRYKYSYYPTVNLNGSYQKNSYSNTYNFFGKDGTWFTTSYAGLSINVPIFSGFAKDANLKKAKLQLQQTQNQIDNLKLSIDNDVAQAQNKFRTDILTVDFQKKNMQLAESVYNQTKKKYESGLASNTDITNAQTDLITAQTNYISALYDAIIAKVDYQKATGKLKY
ncbi:MAG: TolC family protein, partial [Bacteroidetes bacterium]|nr:TolC family protein [Bacteroidota bacterium]